MPTHTSINTQMNACALSRCRDSTDHAEIVPRQQSKIPTKLSGDARLWKWGQRRLQQMLVSNAMLHHPPRGAVSKQREPWNRLGLQKTGHPGLTMTARPWLQPWGADTYSSLQRHTQAWGAPAAGTMSTPPPSTTRSDPWPGNDPKPQSKK